MINMKPYLGLAVFMLLISSCFVPLVVSEVTSTSAQTNTITPFADAEPMNSSVVLQTPALNAIIDNDFNVSFTFEPRINGTDNYFWRASLVVNGTNLEDNQTTLIPYQTNTIYHKFSTNGTYTWNIRLSDNTDTIVWAPEDFTFTIAIPERDTGIAVALISPTNDRTITDDFNVTFVYRPSINGTENKFHKATLIVNNAVVTTNQTAITADSDNTFYCVFTKNGTYTWNIRLENETKTVTAPSNYNFTLTVNTQPTATPTPTPTPTVTPTPTPKPPTATPSPTPTPEPGLDIWTLIIIAVIVFSIVLIVTIFLLRRRAR